MQKMKWVLDGERHKVSQTISYSCKRCSRISILWRIKVYFSGKSVAMAWISCEVHHTAPQHARRETQEPTKKRKTSSLFWLRTHSINDCNNPFMRSSASSIKFVLKDSLVFLFFSFFFWKASLPKVVTMWQC